MLSVETAAEVGPLLCREVLVGNQAAICFLHQAGGHSDLFVQGRRRGIMHHAGTMAP